MPSAKSTLLPEDFLPTVNHVIIGRGKKHSKHSGNLRYSTLVKEEMHAYAAAENKAGKSEVISRLVARVRDTGNFVREAGQGRWSLVEEHAVRTTTAQHFRDALYSKYRSSKEMKKQKRKSSEPKEGIPGISDFDIEEPSMKRSRCVSPEDEEFAAPLVLGSNNFFFQQQQQQLQAQSDALSLLSNSMFMNKVNFQDSNPFEPTPLRAEQQQQQQQMPSILGAFADTFQESQGLPDLTGLFNESLHHDMPFFHEVDRNTTRFAI